MQCRKITKCRTCSSCGNDDVTIKWNKWNSQMHLCMYGTNQVLVIFAESRCVRASSWCWVRFLHSFGADFQPFGMQTRFTTSLILHLFVAFYFVHFLFHAPCISIFMFGCVCLSLYVCVPTKHMFHLKLVFFVRLCTQKRDPHSQRQLQRRSPRKCGCIRNQFRINCYTRTSAHKQESERERLCTMYMHLKWLIAQL